MKFFMIVLILAWGSFLHAIEIKRFIVVSIDALHPDAIEMAKPENLIKLMKNGVYTLKGKSVIPPKTLISHTAMFTGLKPEESGYKSNVWHKGDNKVAGTTIFNDAKKHGFKTYFIYSKEKLGFLENSSVDEEIFAGDEAVYRAEDILKHEKDNFFMFLHISGLDFIGPKYGWLSEEYLDEFRYIDEDIEGIVSEALADPHTAVIVTSDHGGHEKIHGTLHEEDMKLPIIILEKNKKITPGHIENYSSYHLRRLIRKIME